MKFRINKLFISSTIKLLMVSMVLSGCNGGGASSNAGGQIAGSNNSVSANQSLDVANDQLKVGTGITHGRAISTDSKSNIYITGTTSVGISGESQIGDNDTFIAKYSESKTLLWAHQIGAKSGTTNGYGVATDQAGNAFVVGSTSVGLNNQKQIGELDLFVTKYSESGRSLWTRQVGVSGGLIYASAISSDLNGNIYVTGRTNIGISGQSKIGLWDCFITKFSTTGTIIWSRQIGFSSSNVYGNAVTTDSNGNVYVAGSTTHALFVPKQLGNQDYFIAKYDESGNLVGNAEVGGKNGFSAANGIALDLQNNIWVAGYTTVGLSGQTQNGKDDYFIAKYNQNGNVIGKATFANQYGESGSWSTFGNAISADLVGNLYVTGFTNFISAPGGEQGVFYFISKYDNTGKFYGMIESGSNNGDSRSSGIAIDNEGKMSVVGYTSVGLSGQTQNGLNDYFIAHYSGESGSLIWVKQVGG